MTPQHRGARTRTATVDEARAYLAKAAEFRRAATDSYALLNYIAATGNAVHAGIAAADAIAAARSGTVWKGEHAQAPSHLERAAGSDGRDAARHLRRLIPLKSRAEYDPTPVSPSDARAAVLAAERIVAIAERVVGATTA